MRRYEEKKERERKFRERKEAEEKAKVNPSQNSTATVKEITPEEFKRRQKEEAMKKKSKRKIKINQWKLRKKDMLCLIQKKDITFRNITGLKRI